MVTFTNRSSWHVFKKVLISILLNWRRVVAILAPTVALALPFSTTNEEQKQIAWCAYTIIVMAIYWVFECLPIPMTSLIPVVFFPLTGLMSTNDVCINYLKGTNMMFTAGLMMAIAVEHSGLHHRVAMGVINLIGASHERLMLGFMACTMFLSMWISNTAATAMMVPIVDALEKALNESDEENQEESSKVVDKSRTNSSRNFLLLACAYASNIGGTGVVTGSPPNLVALKYLLKSPLSYATWMGFAVPLMVVNTLLAWALLILLQKYYTKGEKKPTSEDNERIKKILKEKSKELGSMSMHEFQVLILFIILILLWFFQSPKFIDGWADSEEFKMDNGKSTIGSAVPAVLVAIVTFLLPQNYKLGQCSDGLLDWHTVEKKLPWGVILLLGGGFAMSEGATRSGLSGFMAEQLASLEFLGDWKINLIVAVATTFVTEVASNTATATILVPILISMSNSLCINPIYLTLTSAISCSYAFMLPVATAPNAIVFSHSTLTTTDMMKTGFIMNIICILTTSIAINTYGYAMFDMGEFPLWANTSDITALCFNNTQLNTTILDLPSPVAL